MTVAELLEEWRPFAITLAREYWIPGADRQDVEQEAMVALWHAARDYRAGHGTTFKTFAKLVIRRHLIECVRAGLRGKHSLLSRAARVAVNDEDEQIAIVELLAGGRDPADIVVALEEIRALRVAIAGLSPLERKGLGHVVAGVQYRRDRQVDNAIQRARRKLRAAD